MKRRSFLTNTITLISTTAVAAGGFSVLKNLFAQRSSGGPVDPAPAQVKIALEQAKGAAPKIEKLELPDAEWKKRLTPQQFAVLRDESTERPNSSPFNSEKRKGVFHCAGCDHPVFTSEMKFESGTGWPSFFTTLPGAFNKKTDFKLIYPRTEYHCAKCGGHHGHIFKDGPAPTGERWCNNGVSLVFKPATAA
jgi:peptide-methionine (R)-S-oxide reductase